MSMTFKNTTKSHFQTSLTVWRGNTPLYIPFWLQAMPDFLRFITARIYTVVQKMSLLLHSNNSVDPKRTWTLFGRNTARGIYTPLLCKFTYRHTLQVILYSVPCNVLHWTDNYPN